MTYLQLVNSVLRRLRENEVDTVAETSYSALIGDFVNDAKQIDRMRKEYEIRKKLVKRAPLPDVEIMVPTTASEYQMRG